jgi:hypothetical protein
VKYNTTAAAGCQAVWGEQAACVSVCLEKGGRTGEQAANTHAPRWTMDFCRPHPHMHNTPLRGAHAIEYKSYLLFATVAGD